MKTLLFLGALTLLVSSGVFGQISFDYSAIELVLDQYTKDKDNTESIINNPSYQHILEHSKKYYFQFTY